MILNEVKDRFAIVARQGDSTHFVPNSKAAFEAAIKAGADLIHADVAMCSNGALVCTRNPKVSKMTLSEAEDALNFPLHRLMAMAEESGTGLLLDPRSTNIHLTRRIAGDARFFDMEDRIAVVARSLKHTKDIRAQSDTLGIVGVLNNPEQYAEFYKRGGNVATLYRLETTPMNIRLAEAREGRLRHPFWVLAGNADVQDVFNACDGLVGAGGMILKDPAVGREAMRRKAAPLPACARYGGD